jgi:hypothetical protein
MRNSGLSPPNLDLLDTSVKDVKVEVLWAAKIQY